VWGRVQGIEEQVEHDLTDLADIGVNQDRLPGPAALQPRLLPPGPGREKADELGQHFSHVKGPFFGPGRPGEIEKQLDGTLQPADLLFEDRKVAFIQAGGRDALGGGLHQDLHGHERVAQLVGDAGRHLPDRRQVLGPACIPLALLEAFDDGADPVHDGP
jgi:hypothetical protein